MRYAALIAFPIALASCGAPQPTSTWTAMERAPEPTATEVAVVGTDGAVEAEASEAVAAEASDAAEGNGQPVGSNGGCPFDLSAVEEGAFVVTYVLPPSGEGTMLWSPAGGVSAELVEFRYEARDENGHASGVERYRCDASGLALVFTGTDRRNVSFDPPLLVLPVAAGESGTAAGSATLAADGAAHELRYSAAWEAEAIAPVGPLADQGGTWSRVRSVVLFEGAGDWTVGSETEWMIGDGFVVPARRNQEIDGPAGVQTRLEEARLISRR